MEIRNFEIEPPKESRIEWLDKTKAVAILLVVLGHVIIRTGSLSVEGRINYAIYTFHMPLFFILSGVTLNINKTFTLFLKKKSKSLMVPTIAFSAIYFVFYVLFLSLKHDGFNNTYVTDYLNNIKSNWLNITLMTPESPFSSYWFLPALFCSEIIVYAVITLFKRRSSILIVTAILLILNRILFILGISLPLSCRESLLAIPFILLGAQLKQVSLQKRVHSTLFWIGYIALLLLAKISNQPFTNMYRSDVGNMILFLVLGIMGSISVICSIQISSLSKRLPYLNWLGKNSLWIYGLHYCFLEIWQSIAARILIPSTSIISKLLFDILGVTIIVLCSSLIIFLKEAIYHHQ